MPIPPEIHIMHGHLYQYTGLRIHPGPDFNVWESVVNTNTEPLPIGKYRITLSYGWNHTSAASDFESRLTFDGSVLGLDGTTHKEEPKDTGGDVLSTGSAQRLAFSKLFYTDVNSDGAKSLSLEFRSELSAAQCSIWDVCIEIIRIQ